MKLLSTAMLLFASLPAMAQWFAGFATIVPSAPYNGLDTDIMAMPFVSYEGERLTWWGTSLSYRLTELQHDQPSMSITLDLAPNELESDDSDELAGIEDRAYSIMAGVDYGYRFSFGSLDLSVETDVSDTHNGQRAVIAFEHPIITHPKRKWLVSIGVEAEYISRNYADYYFGVSEQEQLNSIYTSYKVDSIIQPSATLGGYYQFNPQWMLVSNLRWQALASEIKESPIVDSSVVVDGFVGVVYVF